MHFKICCKLTGVCWRYESVSVSLYGHGYTHTQNLMTFIVFLFRNLCARKQNKTKQKIPGKSEECTEASAQTEKLITLLK